MRINPRNAVHRDSAALDVGAAGGRDEVTLEGRRDVDLKGRAGFQNDVAVDLERGNGRTADAGRNDSAGADHGGTHLAVAFQAGIGEHVHGPAELVGQPQRAARNCGRAGKVP